MKSLYVLYHLIRADFLERTRRYSFLLVLGLAAYVAYGVFTGDIVVRLDEYRGVYNSAWVGGVMTWVSTVILSLAGFYVTKNAILRDEATRVGLVLATTPLRKSFYTLAKTLSNFAVLAAMVSVLAAGAVGLELARGEHSQLEIGTLVAPLVWMALPAMFLVAALAVLFETLPVLRGGAGNVIYFFAWATSLGTSVLTGSADWLGYNLLRRSMSAALKAADPTHEGAFFLTVNINPNLHASQSFLWNGVDWTIPVIFHRLLWVMIAVAIALLSSLFFHRFDPARETWRLKPVQPFLGSAEGPESISSPSEAQMWTSAAGPLSPIQRKSALRPIVVSELLLMLRGQHLWWYAVAALLFAISLLIPNPGVRAGAAAIAWLWPVLIWSQIGAREAQNATESLIFSSPSLLSRQLPAIWMAGVVVALSTGGGMGLNLLFSHDWRGVAAWIAGVCFIPSLALAFGVWTGTSKPFEVCYTALWYLGPMHHTAGLDFTGAAPTPTSPIMYLGVTVVLLALAYFGRRAKLAYP